MIGSPTVTRGGEAEPSSVSAPTLAVSKPAGGAGGRGLTWTATGSLCRVAVTTSSNAPKTLRDPSRSWIRGSSMGSMVRSPVRVGKRATRWMR